MHPLHLVTLIAAGLLLTHASVAQTPQPAIADTDFGAADRNVRQTAPNNDRISGVLPAGWSDNSDWAQVWIQYQRLEQDGRKYLRMNVTQCKSGRAQLVHAIPNITDETFYRLSMRARIAPGTSSEFHIREMGAPYRTLWSTGGNLSADWREVAFDFRLDKFDTPVGLFIAVNDVGRLDISNLRLERRSRPQLMAEMRRRSAGGPRNLLRVTRFPLGLQNGATLAREQSDGDDVQIAADPKVLGPSGVPALRLNGATYRLCLPPFDVPAAFDTHVASLYVRGTAAGKLQVFGDARTLAEQAFPAAGDQWKRVEVPFTPLLLAKAHTLAISGGGELWIDAAQVELGQKATAYASQLPYEVALAVDSPARVQFIENEPAVVRFAVSGKGTDKTLKSRVVSAYQQQAPLPDVSLTAAAASLQQGELRFDRFPDRPLGSFRIEAWVEDAQGQRVSAINELVVHRLHRPRYWGKDAPNSPFGVHTQSANRHVLMAKAAGVNWTRLHDAGLEYIGWMYLEPEKGKWTFHDKELNRYRQHHIKILGLLSTSPPWANYMKKRQNSYFDQFYQPRDLNDFANYVKVVTARYKGVIDTYDVWNEPWIHSWWAVDYDDSKGAGSPAGYKTSQDPAGDFVKLMRTAYQAAKSVDPSTTIVSVNSTTGEASETNFGGRQWTQWILGKGGLDWCDVIVYHHYYSSSAAYPGDVVEQGFKVATGPISEKLGQLPKPVWMTEGSAVRDVIANGLYHHTLPQPADEDVIATSDRLSRQLIALLAQGVKRIFLYSMHAQGYIGSGSDWRVLVTEDGYLHPSAAAHSALAWHLEDTQFVRQVELAPSVHAYLFQGQGRAIAALARKPGTTTPYSLPAGDDLTRTDLFGNPLPAAAPLSATLAYITKPGSTDDLEALLRTPPRN